MDNTCTCPRCGSGAVVPSRGVLVCEACGHEFWEADEPRAKELEGLNEQALELSLSDRPADAEESYAKAIELCRGYVHDDSNAFLPHLSTALNNLGVLLSLESRDGEAEPLYREAIRIQRDLVGKDPDVFLCAMPQKLVNLAHLLTRDGRLAEAEPLYREGVEVQRELAERDPEAFLIGLPPKLIALAGLLERDGRSADAEQLKREARAAIMQLPEDKLLECLGAFDRTLEELTTLQIGEGHEAEVEEARGMVRDLRNDIRELEEVRDLNHALRELKGVLTDVLADNASAGETRPSRPDGGLVRAYRYRHPNSHLYEVATDLIDAERMVGDDYDVVFVHLTAGFIDRIVDRESLDMEENRGASREGTSSLGGRAEARQLGNVFDDDTPDSIAPQRHGHGGQAEYSEHPENGLGLAYRYTDSESGERVWTPHEVVALTFASGDYVAAWAYYRDGRIYRAATADEYQEELEVRIGRRISDGLSEEQLAEYDLISDPREASQWLGENRPDYRQIVEQTRLEMERGVVIEE